MTLIDGYEYQEDVAQHPIGPIKRFAKQEYNISFERCVIFGELNEKLMSQLKELRYNSYIVSYDAIDEGIIILENIYPLKTIMTSEELKTMVVDILNAIKVLKENYLSIKKIRLSNIYQTAHHFKLDCFEIEKNNNNLLVQDLCYLILSIIDNQEKEFQRVLRMYSHLKYQKSINQMIKRIERIKVNSIKYEIKERNYDYKDDTFFSSLLYYIYDQYMIIVVVIVLIILMFLM